MSYSTQRIAWLAFTGLVVLGAAAPSAHAQAGSRRVLNQGPYLNMRPVNPNGFLGAAPTAQQFLFNSRVIGASARSIPPYAFGYNPYTSPVINTGPVVAPTPYYNPYAAMPYPTLSTSPYAAASPYGGALSTSPYYGGGGGGYSLSTTGGYNDPYGGGYGGGGYG